MSGLRIYEIRIQKTKRVNGVVFRDSFNMISLSLAEMAKTFGLKEEKGDFPHLWNRPENYNLELPHLPPKSAYLLDAKKPADRKEFLKFYKTNFNTPFFFKPELKKYCVKDVTILRGSFVKARNQLREIAGYDFFPKSCTIASLCMNIFRFKFLKPYHLAIVPEGEYLRQDNQSKKALKYLKWYEYKHGVKVQHRDTPEGEKKFLNFRFDGFVNNGPNQKSLVIEVYGCAFHGCAKCFPVNVICPQSGIPVEQAFQKTLQRAETIRKHFDLFEIFGKLF